MPLKAFEDFSPEPLRFPIGGKVYEVPPVGYAAGIRLQEIQSGSETDMSAADQWRLLLGPAYDELVADDVPVAAMSRVIMTALTDYRIGREAAEKVWEAGLSPEALAPNGAPEKALTSTDEASTTPRQGSSTGTTSPKASKTAKAPKAPRSPKSASTGD